MYSKMHSSTVAITIFGFLLIFVVCEDSSTSPSNVLLIAMDGFRHDYIKTVKDSGRLLPNFDRLLNDGVTAEYLKNEFTTVTSPNMYSIVTGMHAEHHGIVHNMMFDAELDESVNLLADMHPKPEWWSGSNQHRVEPVWTSNEKANDENMPRRSAVFEWPTATVIEPYLYKPYDFKKVNFMSTELIDDMVQGFIASDDPINLGILYLEEPDHMGHSYGVSSQQVLDVIEKLDKWLGYLFEQLEKHSLHEQMNIILTSDHGMVDVSDKKVIYLDEHIDSSLYAAHGHTPVFGLTVKEGAENAIVNALRSVPHLTVYKKADIPARFRYSKHHRIHPIIVIADEGWSVLRNAEEKNMFKKSIRGNHGYDNDLVSMRPFFHAAGPAFKQNYTCGAIHMVDIYPLMCEILDIVPNPHNDGDLKRIEHILKARPDEGSEWARNIKYLLIFMVIGLSYVFMHVMDKFVTSRQSQNKNK